MVWSKRRQSRCSQRRFVGQVFNLPGRFGQVENLPHEGFTLIEMLVSVTLVLLMMVMFGEIFQLATASVSKQRIMADNDQNARTIVTVLRGDLDNRTFRSPAPFFPEELAESFGSDNILNFYARRGYFSISCNNPADGTDDVLQFTTQVSEDLRDLRQYGRAIPLFAGAGATSALNFLSNGNQPDRDDGQITSNYAASSKAAEVSYFMRGQRLYRRVQLLRDPIGGDQLNLVDPNTPKDKTEPAQPKFFNPATLAYVDYFLPGGVYDTQSAAMFGSIGFWRDFDFSASRTPASLSVYAPSLPINARFHGIDALWNDSTGLPYTPHPLMPSLGQTWNRFGHSNEIVLSLPPATLPAFAAPVTTNGMPREFTTATGSAAIPSVFVGRFTQEETSHPNFRYPQALAIAPSTPPGAWNGNPMDAAGTELTLNSLNGAVNEFQPNSASSRPGVDLLLSNVHEFRVELWDERLNMFVVPGHALTDTAPGDDGIFGTPDDTALGDYAAARQLNGTYGPLGGAPNNFDTWHPQFNRSGNFILDPVGTTVPDFRDAADRPPYRPLKYAPVGTGNAGPPPPGPTPGGAYLPSYWAPGTSYVVGDVVFPRTEDLNANGYLDPGEDGTCGFPPSPFTPPRPQFTQVTGFNSSNPLFKFPAFGLTYAYRCVAPGTSGPPGSDPNWTATLGPPGIRGNSADIDVNLNGVVDPGDTDSNGNGIFDPAEPSWVCEYNVRPLRAIRITIRYEHPTSKQMKQVTLVHSLCDATSVP